MAHIDYLECNQCKKQVVNPINYGETDAIRKERMEKSEGWINVNIHSLCLGSGSAENLDFCSHTCASNYFKAKTLVGG